MSKAWTPPLLRTSRQAGLRCARFHLQITSALNQVGTARDTLRSRWRAVEPRRILWHHKGGAVETKAHLSLFVAFADFIDSTRLVRSRRVERRLQEFDTSHVRIAAKGGTDVVKNGD